MFCNRIIVCFKEKKDSVDKNKCKNRSVKNKCKV